MKQRIITEYQSAVNKNIISERESSIETAKGLWEYLPELPEGADISVSQMGGVWLSYPYDKHLKTQVYKSFQESGWEKGWEMTEGEINGTNGNPRVSFRKTAKIPPYGFDKIVATVIIEFASYKEGSTCKKVVIGKRTVEQDVVEFVCNDEDNS